MTVPVNALRAAGAKVDVVSLRRGRIRGVNLHEPASRVRVDRTVDRAMVEDYDGLFIPGGFINPDMLRQSAEAREFVRAFDDAKKPIASLCHGPWVLASAGILNGRTMTAWPGIRDDMVNAGATWLDQEVVKDGNLVTSRGPQDMVPFIRAVTETFAADGGPREVVRSDMESAPQRDEAPQIMISAMKWLPRPSFRTVLGIALGLGFILTRKITD